VRTRKTIQPRPRRQVLLLLGWYSPLLHQGVARYAREAHWAIDATYQIIGMPPAQWRGDGIICLVTNPKDYAAIRPYLHLRKFLARADTIAGLSRGGHGFPRPVPRNQVL
jgi:hypothetical protein